MNVVNSKQGQEQSTTGTSTFLPQDARDSWVTLPLRVFLGFSFLAAGCDKLFDPRFLQPGSIGYIGRQLAGFAPNSPLEGFLTNIAVPNASLCGLLVMIGELAIGLGTLAGLLSRAAAASGFLLSLALWLTTTWQVQPFFLGSDLPYAVGWLVLLLAGPHPTLSLDGQLKRLREKPALSASGRSPDIDEPALVNGMKRRQFIWVTGGTILAAVLTNLAWLNTVLGKSLASPVSAAPEPVITPGPTLPVNDSIPAPTSQPTQPAPTAPLINEITTTQPAATQALPTATSQHAPTLKPTSTQVRNTTLVNLAALQIGETKLFQVPNSRAKGILVRLTGTQVKAYSATCTHDACEVGFEKEVNALVCPCHESIFDLKTGAPISGPAFKPLPTYTVEVDSVGNVVFIR